MFVLYVLYFLIVCLISYY